MSTSTVPGRGTVLSKDRRTVPQLLAAAAKDTDAASVFYNGTGEADYDSAILVVKGRENVDYVVAMIVRQQLVTPGKPVERQAAEPCCGQTMAEGYRCAGCPHAKPTDRLIPRRTRAAAPKGGE